MDDRMERHLVFAQHTDNFIFENDNIDSYIGAESDMSLESRSFLHRVNRICIMPWKGEREPANKLCMGRQIDVVQKFTRIQSFSQNWW